MTLVQFMFLNHKFGVHYYGQLLALQHCSMRNIGKHRWILYADLDEYFVPRVDLYQGKTMLKNYTTLNHVISWAIAQSESIKPKDNPPQLISGNI